MTDRVAVRHGIGQFPPDLDCLLHSALQGKECRKPLFALLLSVQDDPSCFWTWRLPPIGITQNLADIPQPEPQKLGAPNESQARHIRIAVQVVAVCRIPARPKQTRACVIAYDVRLNARPLRELV